MYTLAVRIAQQGCHGNHAFSYSLNEFMFRIIFSHSGGTGNNLSPMKKVSWGSKVCQIRFCSIGYPIFSAIEKLPTRGVFRRP